MFGFRVRIKFHRLGSWFGCARVISSEWTVRTITIAATGQLLERRVGKRHKKLARGSEAFVPAC